MKNTMFTPLEEESYPEFAQLLFYTGPGEKVYFDASHLLAAADPDNRKDIDDFFRQFSFQVAAVCTCLKLADGDVLLLNPENGHAMVIDELEFLFLSYVDELLVPYINMRMRELFIYGFTMSDAMLERTVKQRFGKDV